jgi:ketosteroid isomerase-like protein
MVLYLRCQQFGYLGEVASLITRAGMAVILLLGSAGCVAQSPPPHPRKTTVPADRSAEEERGVDQQVRELLSRQVEAWNRGDIEGFMAGYWNSADLTFFSNDTETKGWDPTLARYKQRYQSEGHAMGKLEFGSLVVTPLSRDAAFVRGNWHLTLPDGKEPHGLFTLIVRQIGGEEWRIIHDHTSGE